MRIPVIAFAACLALFAPGASADTRHASTISGTVTRAADASAVVGAQVLVLLPDGEFVTFVFSGAGGAYTVDPGPGTFIVLADGERLVSEVYDNVSCPNFACDLLLATQIPLAHGGAVTGVDFALDPQARLTGIVTGGVPPVPQADVGLNAVNAAGDGGGFATTAADGSYELFFDPDSVRVITSNQAQLIDELHPDIPCALGVCDLSGGTVFTLASGQSQGGVDFVLAPGASIGGEVTVDGSGQPVQSQLVEVFADNAFQLTSVVTEVDGSWRVATGMLPGTYRAAVRTGDGASLASEVWDDNACTGPPGDECDIAGGDPIVLAALQVRTDIDFALVRSTGILSGTVTLFDTAAPLSGAQVQVLSDTQLLTTAQSGFDGSWSVEVPPGSYTLRAFGDPPLAEELYPNVQCLGGFFVCAGEAQLITVAAAQDIADLDFALAPVATLSVVARSADTAAELPAEWLGAVPGFDMPVPRFSGPGTPAEFLVLNGGDVRVAARSNSCGPIANEICLGERWPNDPCPALRCDLTTGAAIAVTKGATVTGIEIVLATGAKIAGTLTEAAGGAPVVGGELAIVDINRVPIANTSTDVDGTYTVGGLGGGPYYVFATPPAPLLAELFNDVSCPNSTCALASGTPVATTPGTTTAGIDFALEAGGSIAGSVGSDVGVSLAGVSVAVFDGTGTQVGNATSDSNGDYVTSGLEPGNYFVRFTKPGFGGVLYDGVPCPEGCNVATGTPVAVVAAQSTPGIDAILPDTGQAGPPQLIYLNRCTGGCVVRGGFESSINNTSSIINGTRTLSAYSFGDASFAALTQCARDTFARYNVTITTDDPGNVPHREHMVGGTPQQLGFSIGTGGVSPYNCSSIPNSISFTFAEVYGDDIHELCWTVAQEIAHGFGLDHEFHPPDAMSYINAPTKGFTFETVPCGEFSARPCDCGAPSQNSNAFLTQVVGVRPQLFADGFEEPTAANASDWKTYVSPHPKAVRTEPVTCGVDPVGAVKAYESKRGK